MRLFEKNFWRLVGKYLHKRGRFIQLLDDIKKTNTKLNEADLAGDTRVRNVAENRDSILRGLKRKMMKKPRGV